MEHIDYLSPDEYSKNCLGKLNEIPQIPEKIWFMGKLPPPTHKLLSVVGSRDYTTYGKQAVQDLIAGLKNYPVGIVSGLARGIDGLSHESALQHDLYTLAIPGSGLDAKCIYPSRHRGLAQKIIAHNGGLISELSPTTKASKWTFPARNRLMAGLSDAILLIEATEKSGTLITARLAVEYNRELLAVPGSIFSPQSVGCNQFIKLGATPITTSQDILEILHIEKKLTQTHAEELNLNDKQKLILATIKPQANFETIISKTKLKVDEVQVILMELEISGHISQENGLYYNRI